MRKQADGLHIIIVTIGYPKSGQNSYLTRLAIVRNTVISTEFAFRTAQDTKILVKGRQGRKRPLVDSRP